MPSSTRGKHSRQQRGVELAYEKYAATDAVKIGVNWECWEIVFVGTRQPLYHYYAYMADFDEFVKRSFLPELPSREYAGLRAPSARRQSVARVARQSHYLVCLFRQITTRGGIAFEPVCFRPKNCELYYSSRFVQKNVVSIEKCNPR